MKVVITANNVSTVDQTPIKKLIDAGYQVEEYPKAKGLSEEELFELVKDADVILVGTEKYSASLLEKLDNLKMIARRGVGVDNLDLETLKKKNVIVTRTVGCVEDAVAELILNYILEVSRKVSIHSRDMIDGKWNRQLSDGLVGKTIGFIGFGGIARETAKRVKSFKMNILYHNRIPNKEIDQEYHAQYMQIDELLVQSDFVSINVPLKEDTRRMVNKDFLKKMKPTAYLINTARGPIVNESDLVYAIENKVIQGACLDVFDTEPYTKSSLRKFNNVILTPHIATFTKESFSSMNNYCADAIIEKLGNLNQ